MSEQQEQPRDPVGRQVSALKGLARLVADRAEAEARLGLDRSRRLEAADRVRKQASNANEARYQADRDALERRAREEPEAARAAFEATRGQAEEALRVTRAEAERQLRDAVEEIKKAQADQRWEVGTICEAGLNDAKTRLEKALARLSEVESRLRAIRGEVDTYLSAHRLRSAATGAGATAEESAEEPEPSAEAAGQALDGAEDRLDDLRGLSIPRLFRGARPALIAVLPAAAGAVAGGLLRGWAMAAPVVGVLGLVLGLVVAYWLHATAKVQTQRALGPLLGAIDRASRLSSLAREREISIHRASEQEWLGRRDREQVAADDRARAAAEEARRRYDDAVTRAEEAHRLALSNAELGRDEALRRLGEEASRLGPEIRARFEAERNRILLEHERALEDASSRADVESSSLAGRWRSGLAAVGEALGRVDSEMTTRFPTFEAVAREDSTPPGEVPPALRFGRLRVDLDMFPEGRPADPALMEGLPDRFEPPAILRCPEGGSLLLKADAEGRPAALSALQAVMLRILTGFPPGKARFTMIDPVGLGQTFAAFMHLADVDEQLVSSRVWTETQHIEQRLQDLTEHMENVIQKYLRNEYRSITEYNAKAGEVAEPFRFLVVADFPVRFNEAAARRLLSIAQSGPRCGVHVLVSVDTRQEMPQGIDPKDLERHCAVLRWREGRFRWGDPDQGGFPLELDEPPPPEVFSEVVRAVGRRAEGAGRVEVPFEFLAPKPERHWKESSAGGVAIPIGRAGATKVQQLRLGSGTAQHVLIAGKTGSGKSTLLHALITSAALAYSPDQVEFYLIDFKKGVEFKAYATHRLPHARVIAVESEREFGLSVLQRLDEELRVRGDLFREAGAQDVASFREARPDRTMPRILLIVDEFQEFFVEDDTLAQEAALLLDRLVRQGRAFGIHVHLGSQTLAGAYSLARATIGQMAVRIALQCSESDASLILSDDNTAARLLSRPGEAIYNDANGRLEGNSIFQVVWLPDEKREEYLRRVSDLARGSGTRFRPPIVFEGNVSPDVANNEPMSGLLGAEAYPDPAPKASTAWLGEPVAIKGPTAVRFRRQAGSHLLIVGQNEEAARGLMATSMLGLAAHRPDARFVLLDGTPSDDPASGMLPGLADRLPHDARAVPWGQVEAGVAMVADEVERRRDGGITDAPPLYLLIHDLQRFRQLRKAEDDFSFSSRSPDEPPKPSELLGTILRDGPVHGVHAILWVDTLNNLNRTLDRSSLRELEHRVLFQMSSGDSSTLIDSPLANRLGMFRALLVSEEAGLMERFRPYGPPPADWLDEAAGRLAGRPLPAPGPSS
ncbi:FtsK/SpoIIIE domain-containing protein [Tautonia plasticadhaerens]|uniref:FtsK-like domain-containing protein n=1 Tax=Tautonia plasticadhaerens TaxID=2527974 RepID=A0A518H773_9BACT|nr:FtsK/SpoIIIE domain-containing protein [Tautonia plasticadhaerens]QDV36695.1 FtsK-like domain-containing protein [Tautonia plasticadhaerens]